MGFWHVYHISFIDRELLALKSLELEFSPKGRIFFILLNIYPLIIINFNNFKLLNKIIQRQVSNLEPIAKWVPVNLTEIYHNNGKAI